VPDADLTIDGWLPQQASPRHRRSRLVVAIWCFALSMPVFWVAHNELMGVTACEHPDFDSNYGDLSWSLFPPGRVCRFDAMPEYGRPAETFGPHIYLSLYLAIVAVAGVILFRRRPRP
jgi:hypothetical protein